MKPFSVLDREVPLYQSRLLEASAGTGKTFSIEHLVLRMLLEPPPCALEEILVVTFTRAATRELKRRIRATISRSETPLPQVLAAFDQAQVFTIHGFAKRMLEESFLEGDIAFKGGNLQPSDVRTLIRDFFRTEVREESYSKGQLKIVLKQYRQQIEGLETALFRLLMQGKKVAQQPRFSELHSRFQEVMHTIPSGNFVEAFLEQAPHYKGTCNKQGELFPHLYEAAVSFGEMFDRKAFTTSDFDSLIENRLAIALDPKVRKLRAKGEESKLLKHLREALFPLIEQASHPQAIFACMAVDCQALLESFQEEEELLRPDDLLLSMQKALKNHAFVEKIRRRYRVAIIDEFQDTDPVQWEIFRTLFLTPTHTLYLVGDPKQSIYAFRQADIYTYQEAASAIGEAGIASLSTNFRSQPTLVHALNQLFSSLTFPLPRTGDTLRYHPVESSPLVGTRTFSDTRGAIHFALAKEEAEFFPFILQEIKLLHEKDGVAFSDVAVLVRDRYQADRLAQFFKLWGVPIAKQRSGSLAESSALPALEELLDAVLHPRKRNVALGGKIIGLNHREIQECDDAKLLILREKLPNFMLFFEALMESTFQETSVRERLLAQPEGELFYDELLHIAELVTDEQYAKNLSKEQLLDFLREFPLLQLNEDERLKTRYDTNADAVQILTIHMSKGLEFGIVFTLGLISRTTLRDELVGTPELTVATEALYESHYEELDAEKRRQLYVAMTRAKWRLYVPMLTGEEPPKPGTASPLELFLPNGPTQGEEIPETIALTKHEEKKPPMWEAPSCPTIPGKPVFVQSFSSLAKHQSGSAVISQTGLPAGKETGILLHTLLEHLPYHQEIRPEWIRPYLKGHPLLPFAKEILAILERTATFSFGNFRLCDVDPRKMLHEMEFLYPTEDGHYLKGFIDLVFAHEGFYYIVDWKSNWLPDDSEESLQAVMEQHQYALQARIYREAVSRHFTTLQFGGCYYIFLRAGKAVCLK